jgi:hypothetical protein
MSESHHPRLPGWETRLHDFMLANRERAFAWGEWDCILFACAAAEAITGHDAAAAYRGKYSDETGARAILRRLGQGTLLATVCHEFEAKPVAYAVRGDLIWHAGCVGVCMGATAAFVTDPDMMDALEAPRNGGFVMLPRPMWQKAWAV